ncbi:hypothetical protein BpHYR1_023980, partial [Brachionus plicatilis]
MKKSIARDEDNMIINYTNSTIANVEVQNQNIKINNQNIKTNRSAVEHLNFKSFDEFYGILFKTWETRISSDSRSCKTKKALEYQSEADKEERVVSSIQFLKRKITEVE